LMTGDEIVNKIRSIPEFYENSQPTAEDIMERIKNREDPFGRTVNGVVPRYQKVPIDETYPKTMLENIENWKDYIE